MDIMTTLTAIPGIGPDLPYIMLAMAVASVLAAFLPPPAPSATGLYATAYSVINFVAANVGQAKNAGAPGTAAPPLLPSVAGPAPVVAVTQDLEALLPFAMKFHSLMAEHTPPVPVAPAPAVVAQIAPAAIQPLAPAPVADPLPAAQPIPVPAQ